MIDISTVASIYLPTPWVLGISFSLSLHFKFKECRLITEEIREIESLEKGCVSRVIEGDGILDKQ